MSKNYTTDSNGNIAVPGGSWPSYATALPVVIGPGRVTAIAREIADSMIEDARASVTPVAWVTGNSYMPPLRSYEAAETVWQAENNGDGELWELLVETLEDNLNAASVYLTSPDYDNALYVVDENRWQWAENEGAEDLNDEWEPVDPDAVDDNAENPRE